MGETFHYFGKLDNTELLWTSNGQPILEGQAIELPIATTHPAFQYETYCFELFSKMLSPNTLGIGPHLVDYLFSTPKWRMTSRPDGLIFEMNELYWRLAAMVEIRSGDYKIHKKLDGLASFCFQLRSYPKYFPTELQALVGDALPIPQEILIPANDDLTVIFIGPADKTLSAYTYGQDFQLQHIRIANPYAS